MKINNLEKIYELLDNQINHGHKYLYLSLTKWTLYQLSQSDEIRKGYAEHGFTKVINPITEKEQSVLMYKNFPVYAISPSLGDYYK